MKFEHRADAEGTAAEQPQRQQRLVAVRPLGQDEGDDADEADDVADDGARAGPAPVPALLGDDQDRDQPDDERESTREVDPVLAAGVRQVQRADDEQERRQPDRHVDEEDPAPAGDAEDRVGAGEETAEHRAEDARGAEDGQEVALVLGALARRHDVTDDRQRQGEQASGADALEGACGGELVHRVCGAGEQRADDEDADREDEERPAAVDVAQLAVQGCHDRRGDEVGGRRPGLDAQAVEVVRNRADRRRDDRLVQRCQEHARHEAGEDDDDLPVREGRRCVLDDRAGASAGGRGGGHAFSRSGVRGSGSRSGGSAC